MQLSEIADRAAGSETSTEELLRQLKLVARRTHLPPLSGWVDHELTGYTLDVELPTYRGPFQVPVYGQLSGPYGSGASNVPIPPIAFRNEVHDSLFSLRLMEGVGGLQELATHEYLNIPWPANAVAGTQFILREGFQIGNGVQALVGAKQVVPRSIVTGVLSAVRNRILDLSLELEQIHPGVVTSAAPAERQQSVQVVNAIIYGGAAIGSREFTQLTNLAIPETREDLLAKLAEIGIDEAARKELEAAMADDEVAGKPRLGQKVRAWLAKHANSAVDAGAQEAGKQAAGMAGAFVGQLVRGFLS